MKAVRGVTADVVLIDGEIVAVASLVVFTEWETLGGTISCP